VGRWKREKGKVNGYGLDVSDPITSTNVNILGSSYLVYDPLNYPGKTSIKMYNNCISALTNNVERRFILLETCRQYWRNGFYGSNKATPRITRQPTSALQDIDLHPKMELVFRPIPAEDRVGLSKCDWNLCPRKWRVEKVALPRFKPGTFGSQSRYFPTTPTRLTCASLMETKQCTTDMRQREGSRNLETRIGKQNIMSGCWPRHILTQYTVSAVTIYIFQNAMLFLV
jgi:hypothetical protein